MSVRAPLFISGIGTNVGKTIVSAVLTEQLKADYWKPVQSGDLQHTDSDQVKSLISNPISVIHPETFRFQLAASPHQSSAEEGITILPQHFQLPETANLLLIEGAGGLFVPLSPTFFMIDLIKQFNAEVILVTRDYLGCINHTLLSIHALTTHHIPLKHLVFNGEFNPGTKDILLRQIPGSSTWSQLPELKALNKNTIFYQTPLL